MLGEYKNTQRLKFKIGYIKKIQTNMLRFYKSRLIDLTALILLKHLPKILMKSQKCCV